MFPQQIPSQCLCRYTAQSWSSDDIHVSQNPHSLCAVERVPEGLLGGCISNALPPSNAAGPLLGVSFARLANPFPACRR